MLEPRDTVVLITGASGGIGLATAVALARRGYRLRVVGRTPAKLDAAVDLLRRFDVDVVGFIADFSSFAEVRRLAWSVLGRGEPLHVLVNNAGVWHPQFRASHDGLEDTFAVNHLAAFLLTQLLLPRMRETDGDRRIVHVSSRLHRQAGHATSWQGRLVHLMSVLGLKVRDGEARLDLDALRRAVGPGADGSDYRGLEAYARSKLAQVIFSAELARRESEVSSHAVHPGSVYTDVARDNVVLRLLNPLAKPFLKSPEQGAQTPVHVATSPALCGTSGGYFADCAPAVAASVAADRAIGEALWALSEEWVRQPG